MKARNGVLTAITRAFLAGIVILQVGACGDGGGGVNNFCNAVLDAMDRCGILEQDGDLGEVNGPGSCSPYPPSDYNNCISGCYDEVQCDGFIEFVCGAFFPG